MAEYIQLQKKYYDGIMIKDVLDEFENDYDTLLAMLNRFANMDGADVTERKTGRWKDYPIADGCIQCSACGVLRMGEPSNYCPNCGAKMEVQDDG